MLTKLQIDRLKPAPTRYLKTDDRGLCIDVLPSGVKSFVYRYRLHGKQQKTWLGQYPAMSLKDARDERDRLAQQVKAGKSPADQKRQEKLQTRGGTSTNPTLREFCDRYYSALLKRKKRLKQPAQIRRYIDKEICPLLGEKLLRDVTTFDVKELVNRKSAQGKVGTALHIRGTLKRIFSYAIYAELVTVNPAAMVSPQFIGTNEARRRSLSPAEIRIFLRTIDDSDNARQFKIALRLLLMTMVRKGELIQARWDQVDLEAGTWLIPGSVTKTGKAHAVYLSAQVAALFRELKVLSCGSALVLPGRDSVSKPISDNTLNTALFKLTFDMPDFVIHDLRRTSSTILHSNGFAPDIIEAALGHQIPGIRGVYNTASYAAERKRMLQWWANYLDGLVNGSNLVVGNFGTA